MESNTTSNQPTPTFKFLSYYFDKRSASASFVYQGIENIIFTEKITFAKLENRHFNITDDPSINQLLDRALFLAFILIGISYYKAHPSPNVHIDLPIDEFQANFFNKVFQEGLSQYAYQNNLRREHLAHFHPTPNYIAPDPITYKGHGILSMQSGGKDSILTATLLNEKNIKYIPWYVSSSSEGSHPAVVDQLAPHQAAKVVTREIDLAHLAQAGGYNGHVPITYILESLAIVQAILFNQNIVLASIGQEGTEPHAMIDDLPVNHQWSKTWEAEQLMAEYVKRYISNEIKVGSALRGMSEPYIAEQFAHKCWVRYGFSFSSCNVANYKQGTDNSDLHWCGKCAKCINTYILFSPFLAPQALQSLFNDQDLYAINEKTDPVIINNFMGLLGINGVMKPFECVGTVEELRACYHSRQPGFATLPFPVPPASIDYKKLGPTQDFLKELDLLD